MTPPTSGEFKNTVSTSLGMTEIPRHHSPMVSELWFPSGGNFASQGPLSNVLKTLLDVTTGLHWVEVKNAATQLTMHRAASQQRILWPQIAVEPMLRNHFRTVTKALLASGRGTYYSVRKIK